MNEAKSPGRKRFYEPKVCFNLKPEIHHMVSWDFAYRQARKSNWMQLAADRERFREKIKKFESEGRF